MKVRGRKKRPQTEREREKYIGFFLPLGLLQARAAFLTYRANQRQGMVLSMQAQTQYKDYLKTLILNEDKNLNLWSNFETGAHSMCQITR